MKWHVLQQMVIPYVVRIETPSGSGTGFMFAYNANKKVAAIATAAHVVAHEDQWQQPIKIIHDPSQSVAFVGVDDRAILIDHQRDSASILIQADKITFPNDTLPLFDSDKYKKVGVELGWTGYPGIAYPNLCFFSGPVSAFLENEDCYLIDGVAINGVSGGPVFSDNGGDIPELIGSISAYISNRQGSASLPGLLRAHDLTQAHDVISNLKSLDEAKEKEKENEQIQDPAQSTSDENMP